MGGRGKRSPWTGRHIAGGARQWRFQASHRGGFGGSEKGAGSLTADTSPDSAKRGRPEESIPQRFRSAGGSGKTAGAGDAGGPAEPTAVDLQKRAESRRRTAGSRARGESYAGCGTAARAEVQPAGEPQDEGGFLASGPQCPV